MKTFLGILVALMASNAVHAEELQIHDAAKVLAVAQDTVGKQLKYPGSAQYQNLKVYQHAGQQPVLCGEVDFKTSFTGKRSGFQPFLVTTGERGRIMVRSDYFPGAFDIEFAKVCLAISEDDRRAQERDRLKADAANTKAWLDSLPEPGADYGTYPKNYQEIVKQAMARRLKDPDSAKYSDFTAPRHDQAVYEGKAVYGYAVCVAVNAKNSYGGYTGNESHWLLIRNGQVVDIIEPVGLEVYQGHLATCREGQEAEMKNDQEARKKDWEARSKASDAALCRQEPLLCK